MDFTINAEQRAVMDLARNLALKHSPTPVVSWSDAGKFAWDFVRELAEHGLTGIDLPESVGGQGQTLLDSVLVIEAIGAVAPHLADAIHITNFGAVRQIAAFAETETLAGVLREILAGTALPSIAMTEPEVGSAVSHLRTAARIERDRVVVNGQKIFNTNGPVATHYVVWARFGPAPQEVGAVVVPADAPGFSRGADERFISGEPHCALHFDEVELPADYVLLRTDGIRRMISIFNIERIGNAARSLALGELALALAQEHMTQRITGGKPLSAHQGLRWKIADMRTRLDAARLLIYRAALDLDGNGAPRASNVAIAKLTANEAGFAAADASLQIFGGSGYSSGSAIDYIWRRTRGWQIAGGSLEVLRNRIADEMFKGRVPALWG
ncbi:acyl-CoA dehydrogenase family protein [Dactylosporangium sp. NPDC000555]|uniref:acyl-CoA dehydrogenase family protein n=1 Tax=Dactylosporangium sp. NPDC000555 TaxID=3154260 RepID=UPI00332B34AD